MTDPTYIAACEIRDAIRELPADLADLVADQLPSNERRDAFAAAIAPALIARGLPANLGILATADVQDWAARVWEMADVLDQCDPKRWRPRPGTQPGFDEAGGIDLSNVPYDGGGDA